MSTYQYHRNGHGQPTTINGHCPEPAALVEKPSSQPLPLTPAPRIPIPCLEGYEFLDAAQIMSCHAEGSYTRLFLRDSRKMLISRSLGEMERCLPAEFFVRIHHSTIINVLTVTHYLRIDGGTVILMNGERCLVSKSRKEELLHKLGIQ